MLALPYNPVMGIGTLERGRNKSALASALGCTKSVTEEVAIDSESSVHHT